MVTEVALSGEFAIILVAAALMSIVAKQSGQPTIVAYIITGLVLGPPVLGIVSPGELTETMGELGLAFLLFLLGIKMRIDEIRHVLKPIVLISIPQMLLVCSVGVGVSLAVGFGLWESVLIGLAVMYSSTAVVIKVLSDKDEVTSLPGKIDVGVLLMQDIVVVILLAILAAGQPDDPADIAVTLVVVLVLIAIIGTIAMLASKYLLPPVFRHIADQKDVFFVVAIAWAFLFVFAAEELELSIEMGAFLAGIAIAQLPYSKELQDRVSTLTDLFILVFFVSIGLQLEANELFAYWDRALVAIIVLMPAKFLIFFALIRWQGFSLETTFIGSINMIQVSEFGLVVGAVAVAGGFIDEAVLGFLSLIALVSMALSVYVLEYNHEIYERVAPALQRFDSAAVRDETDTRWRDHAVVVGYDPMTRTALPVLDSVYDVVVVDRTIEHVEELERAGYDVVYGDIRHDEIRKTVGLKRAAFLLSSTQETAVNAAILSDIPHSATTLVEARWTTDALELYEQGADYVLLASRLAGDRLAEYVELFFESPDEFESVVARDEVILQELVPPTSEGKTDD